MNVELTKFGV